MAITRRRGELLTDNERNYLQKRLGRHPNPYMMKRRIRAFEMELPQTITNFFSDLTLLQKSHLMINQASIPDSMWIAFLNFIKDDVVLQIKLAEIIGKNISLSYTESELLDDEKRFKRAKKISEFYNEKIMPKKKLRDMVDEITERHIAYKIGKALNPPLYSKRFEPLKKLGVIGVKAMVVNKGTDRETTKHVIEFTKGKGVGLYMLYKYAVRKSRHY